MKKQKTIGIALLVTAALLVIATGVVFASGLHQEMPPFYPENKENVGEDAYWGPMSMHGYGRHAEATGEFPPMRSAMVEAVAEATDLAVEEIETRIGDGEHLYTIALDAGMSEEAFIDLMTDVREGYFADAVDEGWMTEEQFNWMNDHMGGNWEDEDFGGCHRQNGESFPMYNEPQRGRGGRW